MEAAPPQLLPLPGLDREVERKLMTTDIAILREKLKHLREQEKELRRSDSVRAWQRNLKQQAKIVAILELETMRKIVEEDSCSH
jgi:hypothetical protein